jgi:hypothetical protein
LDDYGDENWDALPQEIERLLLKSAKAENDNIGPVRHLVFKGLSSEDILRELDKKSFMFAVDLINQGIDRNGLDMLI